MTDCSRNTKRRHRKTTDLIQENEEDRAMTDLSQEHEEETEGNAAQQSVTEEVHEGLSTASRV